MSQTVSVKEPGEPPLHTIEVHGVSEALLQRLDERARESGRERSQIIQAILMKELGAEEIEITVTSLDAALAPIRQGFAESDLNEEQVMKLLDDELRAVRQEKRLQKAVSLSSAPPMNTETRRMETPPDGR